MMLEYKHDVVPTKNKMKCATFVVNMIGNIDNIKILTPKLDLKILCVITLR